MTEIEKSIETIREVSDLDVKFHLNIKQYDLLTAIEALQEKAEREKGCEHCKTGEYRDLKGSCYSVDVFPFCPNCGAKMDGGKENE